MKYIRNGAIFPAAILICLALSFFLSLPLNAAEDGIFYVTRVIDGDTIQLSGGQKVRLIGIDTPESYYSDKLLRDARRTKEDVRAIRKKGYRAADFTRKLCLNKRVRLEFDVVKFDKYKRTLAYVYLEDGTFVNAEILRQGYAQLLTIPPNVKHVDHFVKMQKEARENKLGFWKD